MAGFGARADLLRARDGYGHHRVTFIELFFDLVFVFAITQLSHHLLHDLSWGGALRTLILFVAVWWAWIDTSWVTNWADPERQPVRLALLMLMLIGLVLSAALPRAFHDGALVFALAYGAFQVGRSFFMVWACARQDPAQALNFKRILSWHLVVAALWLAGALAGESARLLLWGGAALIETLAPSVGFFVPGLGASKATQWEVEGGHLSERCGLFIIIALGESILLTGATFSGQAWAGASLAAFLVAFLGTVTMWWIYFDTGSERAEARFTASQEPGRMARLSYTYLHPIIVAGIVVCAVSDELILAHPDGATSPAAAMAIIGGPALYIFGNALFKYPLLNRFPLSHLVGLTGLALLVPLASLLSPLALAAAATAMLALVAVWESLAVRRMEQPARPA